MTERETCKSGFLLISFKTVQAHISAFCVTFAPKYKFLNMEHKDLNRLKVVLVEKKKTGTWLAGQLGVTPVTVSKWCSNITQPTLPTLDRIAELLDCEKRELITE